VKIYKNNKNFKFFAKHYTSWPIIDGIWTKKKIINHLPKKQLNVHDTNIFTQNFTLLGKLQIKVSDKQNNEFKLLPVFNCDAK
jgi:hypothetical protein